MALAIFWIALTCILYVYFGYPIVLLVWSKFGRRPVRKQGWEPPVSLLVVMHNESQNVRGKIENCLELDYPKDKLQIIASLDAPTDDTEALAREYCDAGVEVICSSVRRGKAAALNNGMKVARGQIVVFADARQRFARNAIRELVANFADPSVGAVSGELMLMDDQGREASNAVGLYWRYEKALRSMESEIHSVPGASGAIYAIRRELFQPLPVNTFLDDVMIPMRIVLRGKRAVFDSKARAYDSVTQTPGQEYEKKIRTLTGNYELFAEMPQLLVPWRNPIFVQMLSHKAGRLIVPHCLGAMFAANLFLLHGFYLFLFASQLAWYGLACVGWLLSERRSQMQPAPPFLYKNPEDIYEKNNI